MQHSVVNFVFARRFQVALSSVVEAGLQFSHTVRDGGRSFTMAELTGEG